MHCERHFTFQNALIFFSGKKNKCLPNLKFSDPLAETHLLFYFALSHMQALRQV